MIAKIAVRRDGAEVLTAPAPVALGLGSYSLDVEGASATTAVTSADPGKVVLTTAGEMKGSTALPFNLVTTFFSDGVVVTRVTVTPTTDLEITDSVEYVAE